MKQYGLIGFPLSHSFSKKFFSNKFQKEGTNSEYLNFEIDNIDKLPKVINANKDLIGLNVTIPYKEKVIPFLDKLDPAAKTIGAVNTIKIIRAGENILLEGYNSDTYGFYHSLKPLLKDHHKKALILGTGGASKAIKYVFKDIGIDFYSVSRNNKDEKTIAYTDLTKELIEDHKLIINTTPLGTFPNTSEFPSIPYQYLGKKHLLYDLVYNPEITMFMSKGMEAGSRVKNGYEMLELQALKSYEIWNS